MSETREALAAGAALTLTVGAFVYLYRVRHLEPRRAGQWASAVGTVPLVLMTWGVLPWWGVLLCAAAAAAAGWFGVVGIVRQNQYLQKLVLGKVLGPPVPPLRGTIRKTNGSEGEASDG